MSRLNALRAAFGFDKQATDIADGLSVAWSRENVGKILSAMKRAGQSYKGPRGVMGPLFNLSRVARRAFFPQIKRTSNNGLNGSPDRP